MASLLTELRRRNVFKVYPLEVCRSEFERHVQRLVKWEGISDEDDDAGEW